MTLGEKIKTLRESKGLSQDELAKLVGYKSRSSINKIELNINDISQSMIVKIAKALGVSPVELLGDYGQEKKSALPDDDSALNAMILERFAMLTPENRLAVLEFLEQKLRNQGSK